MRRMGGIEEIGGMRGMEEIEGVKLNFFAILNH